jgi:putative transposase
MQIVDDTCGPDGVDATCFALGVCRASYYRSRQPRVFGPRYQMRSPRSLLPEEQRAVLDVFHEDRFTDLAVAQVYATLLDEGRYLCSERTMYRVLTTNHEIRERRAQLMHPRYAAPELLATAPNQLWSWDITKLKGPTTWSYFYLYVIIDVFSRCVVGWMLAPGESAVLAEKLIEETCERHGIEPGQLTIHADRGSSMRSKLVAQLLALTAARVQRQPILRGWLQDAEVPPRLSRTLRMHRGCARVLRRFLRLVQRRASSQRHRAQHARRCPLRPSSAAPR